MSAQQIALLALLAILMAAFTFDRWRIEVVAVSGLAAAFLFGLVKAGDVFAGFSNPAVITVIEVLIVAQTIGRSRLMDIAAKKISRLHIGPAAAVGAVCSLGAAVSVLINNIGALVLMLPVAYSVCAARGLAIRSVLIPLSFATLLGGLCSLMGTPANLIANNARMEAVGASFGIFAFAPIGLPLTILGILWLAGMGWRLLSPDSEKRLESRRYPTDLFLTEVVIPIASNIVGRSVAEVERDSGLTIYGVFRGEVRIFARKSVQILAPGDLLLIGGRIATIRDFLRSNDLQPAVSEPLMPLPAERVWTEIVVMPQSTIVGSQIGAIAAFLERGIQVVGISPQGPRVEGRLGDLSPTIGDVLVLRGREADITDALEETQCVPLAARPQLFAMPSTLVPLIGFAGAIGLATTGMIPLEVALGFAITLMMLSGALDLRVAIREINWPVIVMLAVMLPIGQALETTGTAELLARGALDTLGNQLPVVLLAGIVLAGMLITPFLNNVTTAVVLVPIAASVATQSGLPLDPFLIAVAVGASADFLTPFGHHNNTLVMGLGGYSFLDFPRVGLPIAAIVLIVAPLLLTMLL